jgi:hypothetical protein
MKSGSLLIPGLLVATFLTVLIVISCNKNNSSKPSFSLESISTPVHVNDSMRMRFKFTGGGSISNGTLWSIRLRQNQNPPSYVPGADTFPFPFPTFSGNSGELYFSLPWQGYLNESAAENDTDIFKFYIVSGNDSLTSDTITSPQVVILFQ